MGYGQASEIWVCLGLHRSTKRQRELGQDPVWPSKSSPALLGIWSFWQLCSANPEGFRLGLGPDLCSYLHHQDCLKPLP